MILSVEQVLHKIARTVPNGLKRALLFALFPKLYDIIHQYEFIADTDHNLIDICDAHAMLFFLTFDMATQTLPARTRNDLITLALDFFIIRIKQLYVQEHE